MWREGCDLPFEMHYYERKRKGRGCHSRRGFEGRRDLERKTARDIWEMSWATVQIRRQETRNLVLEYSLSANQRYFAWLAKNTIRKVHPLTLRLDIHLCRERLRLQGSRTRSALALQFYV